MGNLFPVQNKSALSLGSITLVICLLGKTNYETFRLFEKLIVEMGFTSVDDFQTALNACASVRNWETLTSASSRKRDHF